MYSYLIQLFNKVFLISVLAFGVVNAAKAHDLMPTYFALDRTYSDSIYMVELTTWNNRIDIEYYELEVMDEDWKKIPFATVQNIFKVPYQTRKSLKVFIRKSDKARVMYICTLSKVIKEKVTRTVIASRVCSKIKR
tara:strand:+ start:977 stop:1384 length:408 start_codon:yes stop_codon:yes gene_type:complete